MRRSLIINLKSSVSAVSRTNLGGVRFNGTAVSADLALQLAVNQNPLFRRVSSVAYSLLSDEKERAIFQDLMEKEVLVPTFKGLPVNLKAYADLQNPLLKKYNFDPVDFMTGAKEAFLQVHTAMASQEFSNYVNGFSKESHSDALLKVALTPWLYDACVGAMRKMHSDGLTSVLTNVKLKNSALIHAYTVVEEDMQVEEDEKEDERLKHAIVSSVVRELDVKDGDNSVTVAGSEPLNIHSQSVVKASEFKSESKVAPGPCEYPSGSVVALIDVLFRSEDTYRNTKKTETENKEVTTSKHRLTTWTFMGCLSGQQELDWHIAAFDNVGTY